MTEILDNEQIQEPILEDGQTDNLPPMEEIANQTIQSACGDQQEVDFYSKEEFYENFKSVFKFASDTTGIESLSIKEREEAGAIITSNRIYEMATKYAFMRPLIQKNTTKVVETILMIQFVGGKISDVYREKTSLNLRTVLWKKAKKAFGFKTKMAKDMDCLVPADAVKQQKQGQSYATATV